MIRLRHVSRYCDCNQTMGHGASEKHRDPWTAQSRSHGLHRYTTRNKHARLSLRHSTADTTFAEQFRVRTSSVYPLATEGTGVPSPSARLTVNRVRRRHGEHTTNHTTCKFPAERSLFDPSISQSSRLLPLHVRIYLTKIEVYLCTPPLLFCRLPPQSNYRTPTPD
jgi:hypothetical protein